jgi:TRAP-type C4-dicarboxylate transport system substrate-binding protein
MSKIARRSLLQVPIYIVGGAVSRLGAAPPTIKLATGAPVGSSWHDALNGLKQEWQRISGGSLEVKVFAGGTAGDDTELVRKIRRRGMDAIAVSGIGLSRIDKAVDCLNIPMMVDSYEEFDFIRERMAPKVEARIEAKGFKVLNWADIGWVHFFTKTPVRTLDDIRRLNLWISAGDPDTASLYKEMRFQVMPLPITDMLTNLQTGTIQAFQAPPLFAMLERSYEAAKNMVNVRWAPLVGATIISERAWNAIPAKLRPEMLAAAKKSGEKLRDEIRRLDRDAVVQMKKRGLNVIEADAAILADWRKQAEEAYPKLRGKMVPADLFDEVKRLRDQYRAGQRS